MMTEYEACYFFTPDEANSVSPRPGKRRKFEHAREPADPNAEPLFVPLFKGVEKKENARLRSKIFERSWHPKEILLKHIQDEANLVTVKQVVSFLTDARPQDSNGKLRTGLIVTGPDSSIITSWFRSIAESANDHGHTVLVSLRSGGSPNLKIALKYINQCATSQILDIQDDDFDDESKDGRRLNYDLQILCDHVQSRAIRNVLLLFQDSEAFETKFLTQLIQVLSSWSDRIPFVLLFGIATSIELFQESLSRETIGYLDGSVFDVQQVDVEDTFRAFQSEQPTLWLGPGLSRTILQRQKDYIQSHSTLVDSLKYAYMTHFFANPMSILIDTNNPIASYQVEHYEAIRNLPSFRRYAQTLIERKEYETVRTLLDDDGSLRDLVVQEIEIGKEALQAILKAIDVLFQIKSALTLKANISWSEMYILAMGAGLTESPAFKEVVGGVRRLPSDSMTGLLKNLTETSAVHELIETLAELEHLTNGLRDSEVPLRSAYDVRHETLRTTVVAQKVSLSKNTSTLSAQDSAYTKIVDRVYAILCNYFESRLINPQDLLLNEILIFDSKSPYREVFTPKPRFAIERALSSPHDYLNCDCCRGSEDGLSATQPATAILYQLYLESGAVINTADLWSAFWAIVGGDGIDDEESEQQKALALFSRALAELKYLGMVKHYRKKAVHLEKLSWKGL